MAPKDMRAALDTLGWNQSELGRRVKVSANAVSKWMTGKNPIPGTVAAYLSLAVKVKELGQEVER